MAKKKSTNATHPNRLPEEQQQQQQQKVRMQEDRAEPPMNGDQDSMVKLQNLKSLNAVLVKQAHELRVERSSLMSVNGVLELENGRLELEKADVEDAAVKSGFEKEVMAVVVGDRVEEMLSCGVRLVSDKEGVEKKLKMVEREVEVLRTEKGSAVSALKQLGEYSLDIEKERDALKVEVEARTKEASALKAKVSEILVRENAIVQQLRQLKQDNEAVVRAELERETAIEILEKENDSMNITLGESLACNENLKDKIGSLSREKHAIELEKIEMLATIDRLEKEVCSLCESVLVLQAEVQKLLETVSVLEKSNANLMLQRDGLSMEFAVLKDQNKENEDRIRNLLSEKEILSQTINDSVTNLEKTLRESEKIKALLQAEIVELCEAHTAELGVMQEMARQLKNKLELTQKSCETQIEEKKKLVTELECSRNELEANIAEKVRAQKDVQLEKKNVQSLTQNLVELEIRMQDSSNEIQRLGNEKSKLIEAKEAVEAQVELLMKEKNLVHKRLEEAEEDVIKARANSEPASTMLDIVLCMLKKTTTELHGFSDLPGEDEQLPTIESERVKPFVSEIELIKNAFQSREVTMADMRKQLEMMKHSVAEAHKRKSLWKLVSSATTIFAAASVAYVSRGH
ncbi:unnamed protein product [Rhodiola kirilowii]